MPIDSSPEGGVSVLILKTIYEQEKKNIKHRNIFLFPIGTVDLSSSASLETPVTPDFHFNTWCMHQIINGRENYDREIKSFKISHFANAATSVSKRTNLLSFYGLDSPTASELNTVRQMRTFLPSEHSCEAFKKAGEKVEHFKLAFDSFRFKPNEEERRHERIVFSLSGEFQEKRHHAKTIRAWIKKYGDNPKYSLQCCIYNPLFSEEQNIKIFNSILQNKQKPFNVDFYYLSNHNHELNEFLNNSDIVIGVSGCEPFSFLEFNSVAIGKHAILLRAHSYKDWATDEMVTWVEPTGKSPTYDNVFFRKGEPFDQGYIYEFDEEAFLTACDSAISKTENRRTNACGLSLQKSFSKELLVDRITNILAESL